MINTRYTCTRADSFARSSDPASMVQSQATLKAHKFGNAGSYRRTTLWKYTGQGRKEARRRKRREKK